MRHRLTESFRLGPHRFAGRCAAALAALAVSSGAVGSADAVPTPTAPTPSVSATPAQRCVALATGTDPAIRIVSAEARAAGTQADLGYGGLKTGPLPAHCEVVGLLHERVGRDGARYAIRFHLRLPETWNGRFLFVGGGGTDGDVGAAVGPVAPGQPTALAQGYAVVSGDSGHSNQTNADPATGGAVSFGRDPQARADYGHAALKATYDAAQAILRRFYAQGPQRSYYAGCSKGGQEGLAFAERYPTAFDGILVGAPGMSLPRAAVNHAWDAQAFSSVLESRQRPLAWSRLAESFSDADLALVRRAVLDACDGDDGLKDGIVGDFAQCTDRKVLPRLRRLQCRGAKTPACLAGGQIAALKRALAGPHNRKGEALYVRFPWDGGFADPGWRVWKLGFAGRGGVGQGGAGQAAIIVAMGADTLAEIFTTPPTVLGPGMQAKFDYLRRFDFDRDAPAIYATDATFVRSAWDDVNARSSDLDAFRRAGGKLVVYHGVSDPVFSIEDTAAWWREIDARWHGQADETVRLFAVPGMGHCMGGPATDGFDAFSALVGWVERNQAPARIEAAAGPASPWPGRTRPLCPYPAVARYLGKGDGEKAENFACVAPKP